MEESTRGRRHGERNTLIFTFFCSFAFPSATTSAFPFPPRFHLFQHIKELFPVPLLYIFNSINLARRTYFSLLYFSLQSGCTHLHTLFPFSLFSFLFSVTSSSATNEARKSNNKRIAAKLGRYTHTFLHNQWDKSLNTIYEH